MKPSSSTSKKTLYVDADDEITTVIDKILATKEQIIAVVVPRRATVFSSIVNMKLLKRSADQNDKKLVLVTSSQNILPLAGVAGLHVAHNLNSKPYVPSKLKSSKDTKAAESSLEIDNTAVKGVEEGADEVAVADIDETESLQVDNTPKIAEKTKVKKSKVKKNKLKVPDFNKFRIFSIIVAGLFIGLIFFIYWAISIAPKAIITLRGDTTTKDLSFVIKADTTTNKSDLDKKIIPASKKEIQKTETQTVPATGEKDKGNKASGRLELRNCSPSDGSINIPAGTGVSSGDLTFIIQENVSLDPSIFTGGGTCLSGSQDVDVIAQNAGDKYNVSSRDYVVAGFSSVTATGSAMTGGTSNIVKVVSKSDIETAKSKLNNKQTGATEELKNTLKANGFIALEDTFDTKEGQVTAAPVVDTESSQVTVTIQRTYSMVGISQAEMQKLVEKLGYDAGIDKTKQSILDNGLAQATYQLGASSGSTINVNVSNKVTAGPQIDQEALKQEIAGKKRGEVEQLILARPGIKEVKAETSPFWNSKIPKNIKKINLIIQDTPNASSPKP